MQGFWNSTTMVDESVLLVSGDAAGRAEAGLLFDPLSVLSVTDASGQTRYRAGRDYLVPPGTGRLAVPPGSAIPVKSRAEVSAAKGSQPYDLSRRGGTDEILFGASHEYHDMQTLVTYTHAGGAWRGPVPAYAGGRLPVTCARLASRDPLRIVLFGDSISTGCNASKWAGAPPFRPFYGELLMTELETAYGHAASMTNLSLGGVTSQWGVQQIERVIAQQPDLVILAFGMNDSTGGCPTADTIANLRAQMAAVRQARPSAEFILVASMLPNPDWHAANVGLLLEYRAALLALDEPGVAVADVTGVWVELHKRKDFLSITGNGVNHPNDWGHALYAQVLAALLIAPG
jgi:lysophospholipase L1-like esterase